jgi:iron complex outermembrane recepter protein
VQDPFDPTGRGFRFALYDGYGRIPYIRYTQNF